MLKKNLAVAAAILWAFAILAIPSMTTAAKAKPAVKVVNDGIKALGVIDKYECGIMDRVENWFDSLGIKYEVEPKVIGCMMHTEGQCYRDYTFFFEK